MDIMDWDTLFMSMVYLVAMKSKDKKTHIGAVIVGCQNEVISVGFNGLPIGVNDNISERFERPEKYYWTEHAERNSILLAHQSVKGCKMYTNDIPCTGCARSIIQSGISQVIIDKQWHANSHNQWVGEGERTKIMFKEAGVELRFWTGKLINTIHRFQNGTKF